MITDPNVKRQLDIELASRDLFHYCHIKAPKFYKYDRKFLVHLCAEIQAFVESEDEEVLIVEAPPRHGKTRTVCNAVEWILGRDKEQKIITGSYNERLSTSMSRNIRNSVQEEKADADKIVFSDVFRTKIKDGEGSMNMWSLEGGYNNYLATSPTGTATGFGCTYLIIDDLIKNAEEARNADRLEYHWDWFTNTMLSRLEEGGKIIIVMTRWATEDLAGKAEEHFRREGAKVRKVTLKALQDNGTMLCEDILSKKSYKRKSKLLGEDIASANYQQTPIDIKGRLYSSFKTYTELPRDRHGNLLFTEISSYTDTADEGGDYLCTIIYGVYQKEAYVLDVIYTKAPMEETEPLVAKRLVEFGANKAIIESNNGGKGFARSVKRIMREVLNSNKCVVKWFHQSKNKRARILSNSTWVMEHMYFPVNWRDRFPEYYSAMVKYQREGKNKHDDAPDATTGVAERVCGKQLVGF